MDNIITNNPLFGTWLFYVSVLGAKMLCMAGLTARQRFKHKVFISPEDCKYNKKMLRQEEDVERVRRAHLNDLENITVFSVVSFAYIFTNPSVALATMLFRIATAARIMHTIVYTIVLIPQPARAISFFAAYFVTIYMAFKTIVHYSAFM